MFGIDDEKTKKDVAPLGLWGIGHFRKSHGYAMG
jgi:hypothetical protein